MTHEEARTRLPDQLEDRDDVALLTHVRGCSECQRQQFQLGRVDRLLLLAPAAVSVQNERPSRLRARSLVPSAAAAAGDTCLQPVEFQ
jgi:hypothetical protein